MHVSHRPQDAATWLGAHSRASDTQAMRNLLASYPLDSEALRAFAFSLQAMPVTALGPQVRWGGRAGAAGAMGWGGQGQPGRGLLGGHAGAGRSRRMLVLAHSTAP